MENTLSIVCSSQFETTNLVKHILFTCGLPKDKIEFLFYKNNGELSLSEIYNRGLSEAKHQYILFIHHDIHFETDNWGRKLLKHFSRNADYGILGVAGTNRLVSGMWWEKRETMHGIVNHSEHGKTWTSRFSEDQGNKVKEMVVLDGVLFAIDKTKIIHIFDEEFKGFHFYDLAFTFKNHLDGVRVGVFTDIRITHMSVGHTNDMWAENKQQFEEKYKDKLPCQI